LRAPVPQIHNASMMPGFALQFARFRCNFGGGVPLKACPQLAVEQGVGHAGDVRRSWPDAEGEASISNGRHQQAAN
jgi:hypothetical protein